MKKERGATLIINSQLIEAYMPDEDGSLPGANIIWIGALIFVVILVAILIAIALRGLPG
jgi:hypothetical protein